MRRAGTQRYQRRAGWDQLCDAVPRGVLQSKRQSGWKQFDIERATDRLLLSRLVSPRWPQNRFFELCAAPTVRLVDQRVHCGRLRVGVNACASSRLGNCVDNEASGS